MNVIAKKSKEKWRKFLIQFKKYRLESNWHFVLFKLKILWDAVPIFSSFKFRKLIRFAELIVQFYCDFKRKNEKWNQTHSTVNWWHFRFERTWKVICTLASYFNFRVIWWVRDQSHRSLLYIFFVFFIIVIKIDFIF